MLLHDLLRQNATITMVFTELLIIYGRWLYYNCLKERSKVKTVKMHIKRTNQ